MASPLTVRVGTLRGIPVRVHLLLPALALATVVTTPRYTDGETFLALTGFFTVMLLSILAHEAAHAAVARRHGRRVHSITLWPLGGVTECEPPRAVRARVRFALAGLATNLVFALLAGAAYAWRSGTLPGLPSLRPDTDILLTAWNINLALGIVNALPGLPLDGGVAAEALLVRRLGRVRARVAVLTTGGLVGIGFLLGGVSHESILLAGLGGWSLFEVHRLYRDLREHGIEGEPLLDVPEFEGGRAGSAVPAAVTAEDEAPEEPEPEALELAARATSRARLDGLLDRIAAEGIGSLSEDERAFLNEESRRLRARNPGKSPTGR